MQQQLFFTSFPRNIAVLKQALSLTMKSNYYGRSIEMKKNLFSFIFVAFLAFLINPIKIQSQEKPKVPNKKGCINWIRIIAEGEDDENLNPTFYIYCLRSTLEKLSNQDKTKSCLGSEYFLLIEEKEEVESYFNKILKRTKPIKFVSKWEADMTDDAYPLLQFLQGRIVMYVIWANGNINIELPSLHEWFSNLSKERKKHYWKDYKEALRILGGNIDPVKEKEYETEFKVH